MLHKEAKPPLKKVKFVKVKKDLKPLDHHRDIVTVYFQAPLSIPGTTPTYR